MSSYERDAVEGYDDLATDITNFLHQTDGDYYKTLCYLQELRRDCLNKHIEYDVGLLGGHESDHDYKRESLANSEFDDWRVRASDDLHWVHQQFLRDTLTNAADEQELNDLFTELSDGNNVQIKTWLHQLDFYGSQSGIAPHRVFYVIERADIPELHQMLELDETNHLSSTDGPDLYFASDYVSPIAVTLHIVRN